MYAVGDQYLGGRFVHGLGWCRVLLLAMVLGGVTWWRARKNNYPRLPKATWGERWVAFRKSFWGLFLIVVVMGGTTRASSPRPRAAAMESAVYAFIVAVFVYKRHGPERRLQGAARASQHERDAAVTSLPTRRCSASSVTNENIPQAMADWMLGNGLGVISFLLAVTSILLLAGQLPVTLVDHADLCAYPVFRLPCSWHRPDSPGHFDGGEYGSGHVPPAGGAEPVRGLGQLPKWALPS